MTKQKILVTVASRHGSTAAIGDAIAGVLRDRGHEVIAGAPDEVISLSGFPVLVVGSAVYLGHWLKPAVRLVDRFVNELASRSVYAFSSGPVGEPPFPDEPSSVLDALVARMGASDHMTFGGRLVRDELGTAERIAVRVSGARYGDFRDWAAVEAWANAIADDLEATSDQPPVKGRSAGKQRDDESVSPTQAVSTVVS